MNARKKAAAPVPPEPQDDGRPDFILSYGGPYKLVVVDHATFGKLRSIGTLGGESRSGLVGERTPVGIL